MNRHRIKDLREYIDLLSSLGQIQAINVPVDPNLEIGAVIRHSYDLQAPAPLFNQVPGMMGRILGAPVGLSSNPDIPLARLAASVGVPFNSSHLEIIEALSDGFKADPIPPRFVETAPPARRM